jgi:L-ribulokinase
MARKYVLGLDYGTESARALLVATDNGEELATAVMPYPHGVIDTTLPGTDEALPPDWALQHPADYFDVLDTIIPAVLREAGVDGADIVGIGVDFTACTVMPVDKDSTPLCLQDAWKANKHAWCKLWKDHGATDQAARITALAKERGEAWLAQYGGAVSSEWLFPKALHVLEAAPDVYAAADRFIEAADWVVLQLTGEEKRNACCAGYKALYDGKQYPAPEFWEAVNPDFKNFEQEKLRPGVYPAGSRSGGLTPEMAARFGLRPDTAVSAAIIDAHAGVPGCGVSGAGEMVIIMGTSFCHLVCGEEKHVLDGVSGVVYEGILPGLWGYEAGQAAGGDIYAWFVDNCVSADVRDAAKAAGKSVHDYLSAEAERLPVGASGLVCLDWWNGNRSILADQQLSGLMVGMTLGTTPAEMYRALLESTAFGTYTIIRQMEAGGVDIKTLYACGGLPNSNPLCMQIFADVTGREIKLPASEQTVALGSAMWGACAAGAANGGYDNIADAVSAMAHLRDFSYKPDPARHAAYQKLYAEYLRLHDLFGRGGDNVMKNLRAIRREARSA